MKHLLIMFSIMLLVFTLTAQTARPYRHYSTQKVQARLLKEDIKMAKDQSKIERHIANFKLVGEIKEVTIPVVFHILHNQAEEHISLDQVYSQLEALNRDFTVNIMQAAEKHPADVAMDFGKNIPNQLGIQFCLADIKQGNTKPINYISTNVREWGDDDAIKDKKTSGADPIQTDKYLNVWVGNLADTVSGYAQMPGGADKTDGIVIDYQFFGTMGTAQTPYDLGKTMTHLVGSYLGLYELWNESNHCGDDYVGDTPIHNAPNFGAVFIYDHISTCPGYPTEMSINYMDNTDDSFVYMFTVGQMFRMQAVLTNGGSRHQLANSNARCNEEELSIADSRNKDIEKEFASSVKALLSPNPATSQINLLLEGEADPLSLAIYGSMGQVVYHKESIVLVGKQSLSLNVEKWSPGIYFLHIAHAQKNKTYRFMVTHE